MAAWRRWCRLVQAALLLCLLGLPHLCAAVPWTAQTLPDPQREPEQCGRDTAGWLCSPDGLVTPEQLDVIQGNIVAIRKGQDPYSGLFCDEQQTYVPVEMLVVIVSSTGGSGSGAERMEEFVRGIHDRFGVGTCGSGVVLALATEDRQSYISVGALARRRLSPPRIDAILGGIKPALRAGSFGGALESAVVEIGLTLAGKDPASTRGTARWWSWLTSLAPFGLFGGFIGFVQLGGWRERRRRRHVTAHLRRLQRDLQAAKKGQYVTTSCPICFNDFDPSATAKSDPAQLASGSKGTPSAAPGSSASKRADGASTSQAAAGKEQASEEQAALLGDWRENADGGSSGGSGGGSGSGSGVQPFMLPCGHTFCEPCISKWLERNAKCPVCRESAHPDDAQRRRPGQSQLPRRRSTPDATAGPDDGAGGACATRHQALHEAELAFRLAQLRRRYPGFVSQAMADEMVASGGAADWARHPDFLAATSDAARAERGAAGHQSDFASFGGGSSAGGGGSSW